MPRTAIASLVLALAAAAPALAQEGNASTGEVVFKRCSACHAVGEGAKPRVGPPLNGVVDGKWAHYEGYAYSKVLMDGQAAGKVWDAATLSSFLENPRAVAPGTKMAFPGLKKPEERADVIAYLRTFLLDGTKAP
ncbi:c-type cytochrome [Antarcticirhabdus aurantiaca]|uniref:Cytochrome c family protein n=1 Tax=Antarcticirhabdus aurantiaca TaxID=2606717 RepID=A0ACD4NIK6_9HYPH|nr:cytochrome c family protein [Antarcticirhabdus aurantiaca]WAJ26660.1 cytochrome c family protein [Jeongeuplla avenae]